MYTIKGKTSLCSNPLCLEWPYCKEKGCEQEWELCPIDFKKEAENKYPFLKPT